MLGHTTHPAPWPSSETHTSTPDRSEELGGAEVAREPAIGFGGPELPGQTPIHTVARAKSNVLSVRGWGWISRAIVGVAVLEAVLFARVLVSLIAARHAANFSQLVLTDTGIAVSIFAVFAWAMRTRFAFRTIRDFESERRFLVGMALVICYGHVLSWAMVDTAGHGGLRSITEGAFAPLHLLASIPALILIGVWFRRLRAN
jgi:hypothetical protein